MEAEDLNDEYELLRAETRDDKVSARAMIKALELNRRHYDKRFDELEELIKSGFPNGEPSTHRTYHEAQMRAIEEKRKLWIEIRNKSIVGFVWFILAVAASALWAAFKEAVRR